MPLILEQDWMRGVTSLEVYNSVYNVTDKNNSLLLEVDYRELEVFKLHSQLISSITHSIKTHNLDDAKDLEKF